VAPNTIYWYFGDKDDVLIAVLDAVMSDIWPLYQDVAGEAIPARLLWVVHQLHQMSRLVTTVHARVEHSAAVAEWHHNFHVITGSLLRHELESAGVSTPTVEAEVMIGIFTIEGLLMHPMSEDEQRTICDTLAGRWNAAQVR
jgi:AcrR family transcriptional regulator